MKQTQDEVLNDIYNLILNPGTRDWERSLLLSVKNALEVGENLDRQLSKLEAELRPLALRNNLTPDVTDFYHKMTDQSTAHTQFDFKKHSLDDPVYQDSAVFAGGCFWCMVEPFENRDGIISVLSGYTGGHIDRPTYDQVSGQYSGHLEAVEIIFDTRIVQYAELVELYWQLTDPTDASGQFQDRGNQYRPVIFVKDEQQRKIAEVSKQRLADSGKYTKPIVTSIEPASVFWPAENYHQQFYKKNPERYKRIERSRRQLLAFQRLQNIIRNPFRKIKR